MFFSQTYVPKLFNTVYNNAFLMASYLFFCVVLLSLADPNLVIILKRILPPLGDYLEAEGNHSQQHSLAVQLLCSEKHEKLPLSVCMFQRKASVSGSLSLSGRGK